MMRRSSRKRLHGQKRTASSASIRTRSSSRRADEEKEKQFEFVVKMAVYRERPDERQQEPAGRLRGRDLSATTQSQLVSRDRDSGQTSIPNGDFAEAVLNTSFDWNGAREPYILATENDVLNGLGMLFMKLLTNRAQMFADVRTYWSPEAVKKATGYELEGVAKESRRIHPPDQLRCLHVWMPSGQAKDAEWQRCYESPGMNVTEEDQKAILEATTWNAADFGYFRGGGYSSPFRDQRLRCLLP